MNILIHLVFVHPDLDLVAFFVGIQERSVADPIFLTNFNIKTRPQTIIQLSARLQGITTVLGLVYFYSVQFGNLTSF